jgi:hypothetical protein
MEGGMADVSNLEEIVAEYRERYQSNRNDASLQGLATFDAVTTLLVAAVDELREIRQLLKERPNA